jgi:hypothetical protein
MLNTGVCSQRLAALQYHGFDTLSRLQRIRMTAARDTHKS